MIVYVNEEQKNLLDQLKSLHAQSQTRSIHNAIVKLTKKYREKDKYIRKTQIGRDGLLGSLRRIDWAYKEYEKLPPDNEAYDEGHDIREAIILVFFHNARCLVEIVKKNFPRLLNELENKKLFSEIMEIRHFIIHAYEKEFRGSETFIRIDPNHSFNDGLFKLQIFDLESGRETHCIYFSLANFFAEIGTLVDKIINYEENYIA